MLTKRWYIQSTRLGNELHLPLYRLRCMFSDDGDTTNTLASLKRRISHLEEENNDLRGAHTVQRRGDSRSNAGRAIRRLVSLTDDIGTLVDEHDRRLLDSVDAAQCTEEENRRYCCYKELVQWVPSIKQLLHSQAEEHVLRQAFKEVRVLPPLAKTTRQYPDQFKHGAEAARSDDSSSLKKVIAHWLNECSPPPDPLIKVGSKSRRGLYNNATAELLCPVEYDWSDKT
ncbi:hypothetical protein BU15DRAFT_67360 [Melanogaster broomeanus]|nr:hypothetical protein BU15DRAFT_67360 [Melanogaster broomeanus]